jgi:ribosomal protein L16/L10AE
MLKIEEKPCVNELRQYLKRYEQAKLKLTQKKAFFEIATGGWTEVAVYELKAAELEEEITANELEEARRRVKGAVNDTGTVVSGT